MATQGYFVRANDRSTVLGDRERRQTNEVADPLGAAGDPEGRRLCIVDVCQISILSPKSGAKQQGF